MKSVLILCTGNSARSQMAEGLLRQLAGGRFEVHSAGTHASSVRPEAVAAMAEIGIDISFQRSKSADEFAGREIDFMLTVCDNAKETCPFFPAATRVVHRSFEDPPPADAGAWEERMEVFRRVRDEMREYFEGELLGEIVGGAG